MNFYFRNQTIKAKEELQINDDIKNKIGCLWRDEFSGSNKIGNVTNLFRILNPESEKDFCDKYFEYAEKNKHLPISQRGLTFWEFLSLVSKYKEMGDNLIDIKFDIGVYFNDALCHIITETYDGKKQEREFIKFLLNLGYNCSYVEGKLDGKYGIDIKVTRNDGKVSAIQIKPITFFKSTREDVVKDRISMCHKYENALKDFGIKTYYAVYMKNKQNGAILWLKNGNGYRFKIEELCSYDPNNIEETYQDKILPKEFALLKC